MENDNPRPHPIDADFGESEVSLWDIVSEFPAGDPGNSGRVVCHKKRPFKRKYGKCDVSAPFFPAITHLDPCFRCPSFPLLTLTGANNAPDDPPRSVEGDGVIGCAVTQGFGDVLDDEKSLGSKSTQKRVTFGPAESKDEGRKGVLV